MCLFWGNLYRIEQLDAYGEIKGLAEIDDDDEREREEEVDDGFISWSTVPLEGEGEREQRVCVGKRWVRDSL